VHGVDGTCGGHKRKEWVGGEEEEGGEPEKEPGVFSFGAVEAIGSGFSEESFGVDC